MNQACGLSNDTCDLSKIT